jgi:hypothetical protein
MTEQRAQHALVVGAGIGGLAAAAVRPGSVGGSRFSNGRGICAPPVRPSRCSPTRAAPWTNSVLGRPIEFVDAPPESAQEAMVGMGLPTVRDVTGREPSSFVDWLRQNLAAFTT